MKLMVYKWEMAIGKGLANGAAVSAKYIRSG